MAHRRYFGHVVVLTGISGFAYAFHRHDLSAWRKRFASEIVPLQDSGKEDDAMFVKYKRALDTSKPLVVLFQPLGSSALEFRAVQNDLFDRGYSSVAVDRGCSGLSSLGPTTPQQSARQIEQALQARIPEYASTRKIVVGCWDGAQMAQVYALGHHDDVVGKVFMSPMGPQRLWSARGVDKEAEAKEGSIRSMYEHRPAEFRAAVKARGQEYLQGADNSSGFQGKDPSTVGTLRSLASSGLLRLMRKGFTPYPGVPEADKNDVVHHFLCVGTYDQLAHEWTTESQSEYEEALVQGWGPGPQSQIPTVVYEPLPIALERTMSSASIQSLYSNAWMIQSFATDFLATSTKARLVTYDGGLNPHLTEPHLVVEAVCQVAQALE